MTNFNRVEQEYLELSSKINHYANLYYTHDISEISDAQYDALYERLKELERVYPLLKSKDSATNKIIAKVLEQFDKVTHTTPMLSIDNAMNQEQANAYYLSISDNSAVEQSCEPKYDGLAISLKYSYGVLVQAVTRGDGLVGEDVTAQVKMVKNIPQYVDLFNAVSLQEVRGEVLMRKSVFNQLNELRVKAGDKPFVNTRNAAAGSIRQLDPNITKERNLTFYAYTLYDAEVYSLHSQSESIAFLKLAGFTVSDLFQTVQNFDEMQSAFEQIEGLRDQLDFDIDGVVFKVNNFKRQAQLGWLEKTPKWAIAYKFTAKEEATKLLAIDIQIGRTGQATPVARLVPVFVGGTTVSNVSLHNEEEISRLDLRIGDIVFVKRAGDVIPKITGVDKSKRTGVEEAYAFPHICPSCSGPLEKEGALHFCSSGFLCPDQKLFSIVHFCSRKCMNIEGFGEGIVKKLMENNLISTPLDLISLQVGQISVLKGFEATSERNMLEAIKQAKGRDLYKFIFALGIPNVGEATAKDICKAFKTYARIKRSTADQFLTIADIGPITAKALEAFFLNDRVLAQVDALFEYFAPVEVSNDVGAEGVFLNKTIVITGTLSKSRDIFKELAEKHGAKIGSSVSKKTNYVLAGENAGSNLKKAQDLQVTVLTEAQFMDMISGKF